MLPLTGAELFTSYPTGKNRVVRARLLAVGCVCFALSAANWEEKEKYHYLPGADEAAKTAKRSPAVARIFKTGAPAVTRFEVVATTGGSFTGARGTSLVVPGSAFVDAKGRKVTQKVRLELIEVIDPLDFVTADVDLTFFPERGGREMFQSAGMFRVNAHEVSGGAVSLRAGKGVRIQFPNIRAGEEFFVYRHDAEDKWKLHGHNQQSFPDGPGELTVGTRRYTIDALNTWWNFDVPKPEGACAKGRVVKADGSAVKNFSVYSIGISYKGTFARRIEAGSAFKVNVHKSAQARFLVIENSGQLGISVPVSVTDKTGFDGAEEGPQNFCQEIGEIKISAVDETILADKKKLSDYLGLEVTEYKVRYQNADAPR